MFFLKKLLHSKKGSSLLLILILGGLLLTILTTGVATYATTVLKQSKIVSEKTQARSIAMAGITYYRWVLHKNPSDYWDGNPQGTPGPYTHEYTNKDGERIGVYSLNITSPEEGGGQTIIESTGWLDSDPNQKITLRATLSSGPFITPYVIAVKTTARLQNFFTVSGKVHANFRVLCNTEVNNTITGGQTNYGVYGNGGPQEFWEFPVPEIDFVGIGNATVAKLLELGNAPEGMAIPHAHTFGGGNGLHLVFQPNGTFDLYRVTQRGCYCQNVECSYRYCYDIGEQVFIENRQIPQNGVIIVDDSVYISGIVNGRVSILGGQQVRRPVFIPDNLTYLDKSGNHVMGIYSRTGMYLPKNIPDNMEINAVLMNPDMYSLQRRAYSPEYPDAFRNNLEIYGSIITYYLSDIKARFAGEIVSGFQTASYLYDEHLTNNPPPGFLTTGGGTSFTIEEIDE